jgi:hypothetical protein
MQINWAGKFQWPIKPKTSDGWLKKIIDKHIGGLLCQDMYDRLKVTP